MSFGNSPAFGGILRPLPKHQNLECSPSFDKLRTVSKVEPLGEPVVGDGHLVRSPAKGGIRMNPLPYSESVMDEDVRGEREILHSTPQLPKISSNIFWFFGIFVYIDRL